MVTRAESAAATRSALLRAAGELPAERGPEGVTLREVGARAGVSRGAPYGHFPDKEHLLVELAIGGWRRLVGELSALRADTALTPRARLDAAMRSFLSIARDDPHLYALMFAPTSRATADLEAIGTRSQVEFLPIVADVVGHDRARITGALLLSAAHGAVGLERSAHLTEAKWGVRPDDAIRALVETVASTP